jgi:hypothetical protein
MGANAPDRLYKLLPAIYRTRDVAQGEPLRALLTLIQREYDALELDVEGLYENWFIETCQEWVVPYIGDLLGVRPLFPARPGTFSARAYVAHTLDYRRRKGTAAMLEQLAQDATGWPSRTVEFFQLLATTQYVNHLRPANQITPDLRKTSRLELLDGPFDGTAHTADVRHISDGRGRYNIPSLGIFLWKLENYFVGPGSLGPAQLDRQSRARAAATPADGRFTFDPLGFSAPLFNMPQTKTDETLLTGEINVPGMLRRRPLYDELEARRQAKADNGPAPAPVYFGDNPVLQVFADGVAVSPDEVMICDISDISATDWRRPQATKSYTPAGGGPAVNLTITASVDPVRGRIAFPAGKLPKVVEVAYNYGFSGDVGAGPYDRSQWLADPATGPGPFSNPARWQTAVSQRIAPIPNTLFPTLSQAVQSWNSTQPAGTDGVIVILDNGTYQEDLVGANGIVVREGSRLLIVAADWATLRQPSLGNSRNLDPNGLRPHLLGKVEVNGTAPPASQSPGELYIDGLFVEGAVTVLGGTAAAPGGNLGRLSLSHSTLAPGGSLRVAPGDPGSSNNALTVNLYRSICGPISLTPSVIALNAEDSIISSGPASGSGDPAISAPGSSVNVQATTVFGTASGRIVEAGNSVFTGTLTAQRRQAGCVRFSYIPPGSQTAQRYHCQPDLAIAGVKGSAAQGAVEARVTPQFTADNFGQPAYAQLSSRCAGEITSGAEDGSEMGAFSFLQQPQRRANLLAALDEYLRFGLEAGMIEET